MKPYLAKISKKDNIVVAIYTIKMINSPIYLGAGKWMDNMVPQFLNESSVNYMLDFYDTVNNDYIQYTDNELREILSLPQNISFIHYLTKN